MALTDNTQNGRAHPRLRLVIGTCVPLLTGPLSCKPPAENTENQRTAVDSETAAPAQSRESQSGDQSTDRDDADVKKEKGKPHGIAIPGGTAQRFNQGSLILRSCDGVPAVDMVEWMDSDLDQDAYVLAWAENFKNGRWRRLGAMQAMRTQHDPDLDVVYFRKDSPVHFPKNPSARACKQGCISPAPQSVSFKGEILTASPTHISLRSEILAYFAPPCVGEGCYADRRGAKWDVRPDKFRLFQRNDLGNKPKPNWYDEGMIFAPRGLCLQNKRPVFKAADHVFDTFYCRNHQEFVSRSCPLYQQGGGEAHLETYVLIVKNFDVAFDSPIGRGGDTENSPPNQEGLLSAFNYKPNILTRKPKIAETETADNDPAGNDAEDQEGLSEMTPQDEEAIERAGSAMSGDGTRYFTPIEKPFDYAVVIVEIQNGGIGQERYYFGYQDGKFWGFIRHDAHKRNKTTGQLEPLSRTIARGVYQYDAPPAKDWQFAQMRKQAAMLTAPSKASLRIISGSGIQRACPHRQLGSGGFQMGVAPGHASNVVDVDQTSRTDGVLAIFCSNGGNLALTLPGGCKSPWAKAGSFMASAAKAARHLGSPTIDTGETWLELCARDPSEAYLSLTACPAGYRESGSFLAYKNCVDGKGRACKPAVNDWLRLCSK